jgi:hypothetical protein
MVPDQYDDDNPLRNNFKNVTNMLDCERGQYLDCSKTKNSIKNLIGFFNINVVFP